MGRWVHVYKRCKKREREKGRGARGVIISLPCPLGPHHHHTVHSHSTIGQHCGLKAVIYQFIKVNLISHLRLSLCFNTKSPVKMQTQA